MDIGKINFEKCLPVSNRFLLDARLLWLSSSTSWNQTLSHRRCTCNHLRLYQTLMSKTYDTISKSYKVYSNTWLQISFYHTYGPMRYVGSKIWKRKGCQVRKRWRVVREIRYFWRRVMSRSYKQPVWRPPLWLWVYHMISMCFYTKVISVSRYWIFINRRYVTSWSSPAKLFHSI